MCPVTAAAMAITAVGATGAAAVAVGVVVGAGVGAAIGVGVSGIVNVATGRGFFENAGQSALFGAIGGGFAGAFGPTATFMGPLTPAAEAARTTAAGFFAYAPSGTTIALTAAAGSLLTSFKPPDFQLPAQTAQVAQLQQFNSQQLRVTGSGGVQAAASLADAIKRSKARQLTQRDVGDLSIDTASFAGTGLQFA